MFSYSLLLFFLLSIGHCSVFSAHDIHRLKDEKGQTKLHKLCLFKDSEDEIEILLKQEDENGIDDFITAIDNEGNTALHLAAISKCCSEKTLESIIRFYKKAIGKNGKKLFQLLMAENKKKETPLQLMVQTQRDKHLIVVLVQEIILKCKEKYKRQAIQNIIYEIIKGGKNFIIAPIAQKCTYYDELKGMLLSVLGSEYNTIFAFEEIQLKIDENDNINEEEYISFIQKRAPKSNDVFWLEKIINYKGSRNFNILGFFVEKGYSKEALRRFMLLFPEEMRWGLIIHSQFNNDLVSGRDDSVLKNILTKSPEKALTYMEEFLRYAPKDYSTFSVISIDGLVEHCRAHHTLEALKLFVKKAPSLSPHRAKFIEGIDKAMEELSSSKGDKKSLKYGIYSIAAISTILALANEVRSQEKTRPETEKNSENSEQVGTEQKESLFIFLKRKKLTLALAAVAFTSIISSFYID